MSTLKVDGIRSNSATSDAITLDGNGKCAITGTTITADTGNFTNLPNRNLIINGAMQVAQRGTSSTAQDYGSIDRFRISSGNLGSITLTQSQQQLTSSDTPYSSGFRYFYRSALSGAGTVNTNSHITFQQRLEAQDVAQSGWNYTSATSFITLQFWFRCSTNQTFYCSVRSQDGTQQSYAFSFTASANNTWTKITKTIPGAANVQFDLDNERGLSLMIVPFYGTYYTGTKSLDQWSAYSGTNEYPDFASTWLTAGASTFDITGVQLEVGSVATDFEHRSFGQELALCKRYFEKVMVTSFDSKVNNNHTGGASTTFAVEKRDAPTCTRQSNFYEYNSGGQLTLHTATTYGLLATCSGGGNKSQQLLSSLFHCDSEL